MDARSRRVPGQISIRLRPYRRESRDHAPGPSPASANPIAARVSCKLMSSGFESASDNSITASRIAASGVQTPRRTAVAGNRLIRRSQAIAADQSGRTDRQFSMTGAADTIRSSSRPAPGHPFGNVVNNRCMAQSIAYEGAAEIDTLGVGFGGQSFRGRLELNDSPPQCQGHRMCSIVCSELGKNTLDVAFRGCLRNEQLCGDNFV